MNQNYNTPIFVYEANGDDEILPNPLSAAFKAAYPSFNEALKWAIYGGKCILKLVYTDSIAYDFNSITVRSASHDPNSGDGNIILSLITVKPDQSTSETPIVIRYGGRN